MKTIDKIFIGIIIIELLTLIPFLLIKNPCGSGCAVDDLLNPMNIIGISPKLCTAVCVETLYPPTYLIADILILTTLIYIIILFTRLLKGGLNN